MKRLSSILLFVLTAGLIVVGCDTATVQVDRDSDRASDSYQLSVTEPADFQDELKQGVFTVCKDAPDDPMQAFTFTTTVDGADAGDVIRSPVDLKDGQCEDVFEDAAGEHNEVTITEEVPEGWQLDGITIYSVDADGNVTTHTATGPTISGQIDRGKDGCLAVYHNSKVPTGGEGCTPGAWKNRLLDIGAWPVPEDTPVEDVFNVPASLEGYTLLEALSFDGGPAFDDKVKILLRAATAAYLNAQTVEYDWTTQQVIDAVNAAIASGDKDEVIDLAEMLDGFNNQDCPITDG